MPKTLIFILLCLPSITRLYFFMQGVNQAELPYSVLSGVLVANCSVQSSAFGVNRTNTGLSRAKHMPDMNPSSNNGQFGVG